MSNCDKDVAGTLVYVIDDELTLARALCAMLNQAGYETKAFPNGLSGVEAVCRLRPQAVLLDLMLPDIDGIEVLRRIREGSPNLPVIMMSGQGTVKTAVEALKLGAYDFLEKPVETNHMYTVLRNALERQELQRQVGTLREELAGKYRMVGKSSALDSVRDLIARAAPTTASVLITGESGVGKELVARAIHMQSRRAAEPFVALNCAAIPKELIESELFGHEKGAFTGADSSRKGKLEVANKGTFFLDEVGDMSMAAQAKLLRFLENSEVQRLGRNETTTLDVRVLAATNKNLDESIRAGTFREDLYHRLNVVMVRVPPLRERPDDIESLASFFLERYCFRYNRSLKMGPGCTEVLQRHDWPGNVRELRNIMERVVVLAKTNPVEPEELRSFIGVSAAVVEDGSLKAALDKAEREAVEKALAVARGNVAAAARTLGIERPSMYRIMKRHGIAHQPEN